VSKKRKRRPQESPAVTDEVEQFAREHNKELQAATTFLQPLIEDSARWEQAARYWYLILVGDDAPHRRPKNPDTQAQLRYYLQRIYPDDPNKVKYELAKARAEAAVRAEQQCWGPGWCYLRQALAARCGISEPQFLRMTFQDVATALKKAVERRDANRQVNRSPFAIEVDGQNVRVSGQLVALNMTPERTEDVLHFLKVLIANVGNWISGPEIGRVSEGQAKAGVRWDRIFKSLPECVRQHVKSNRKLGYRILA
jgi:hypothetical protein